MPKKILDLFCGAGGFSKGFQMAGYTKGLGIDFEKHVKETFENNHPDYEFILSDIKELNPEDYTDFDIVIGSPPCKMFSVANKSPNPEKGMELVNIYRHWVYVIKPDGTASKGRVRFIVKIQCNTNEKMVIFDECGLKLTKKHPLFSSSEYAPLIMSFKRLLIQSCGFLGSFSFTLKLERLFA